MERLRATSTCLLHAALSQRPMDCRAKRTQTVSFVLLIAIVWMQTKGGPI